MQSEKSRLFTNPMQPGQPRGQVSALLIKTYWRRRLPASCAVGLFRAPTSNHSAGLRVIDGSGGLMVGGSKMLSFNDIATGGRQFGHRRRTIGRYVQAGSPGNRCLEEPAWKGTAGWLSCFHSVLGVRRPSVSTSRRIQRDRTPGSARATAPPPRAKRPCASRTTRADRG